MNVSDLLTPWVMLIAVLAPLIYIEKWIHSHLYGVGWLLTDDEKSATILYYILLFPGVLIHELVQWLVAGAMRIKTKQISIWPEPQKDGTLRLDFVQLETPNRISAAIIGAAPLVVGLVVIWAISNYILNLDDLFSALSTGELAAIADAIVELASMPDFYLWLYLLFAISNAMIPTPADREGWPLIAALLVAVIIFLVVIGTGDQLLETYQDTVIVGIERLTTAFATVLAVELPAMLLIGFGEEVLERVTQRKFQYVPPQDSTPREPGSSEPLPPGEPKPSVYLLDLPVPLPPERPKPRPAASGSAPRPARDAARTAPPQRQPSRATGPTDRTMRPDRPSERERPSTPERARAPDERVERTSPPEQRPARPPDQRPERRAAPTDETHITGPPSTDRPHPPGRRPDQRPDRRLPRATAPTDRTRIGGSGAEEPTLPPTSDRSRTDRADPSQRESRRPAPERDRRFRRPDTVRPSGPRRAPMPEPTASDEGESRERPFSHPNARPEHTRRPERTGRRGPQTPSVRPSFQRPASPPHVEQNIPDEDDELEYVPFDDVELPPDDDF